MTSILLEAGSEVTEGSVILQVEAMKMQFGVVAGVCGTIKEILCNEGDQVSQGETLVFVKSTDDINHPVNQGPN